MPGPCQDSNWCPASVRHCQLDCSASMRLCSALRVRCRSRRWRCRSSVWPSTKAPAATNSRATLANHQKAPSAARPSAHPLDQGNKAKVARPRAAGRRRPGAVQAWAELYGCPTPAQAGSCLKIRTQGPKPHASLQGARGGSPLCTACDAACLVHLTACLYLRILRPVRWPVLLDPAT